MADIPGKEHAASAVKHVKKLPPWALVAVGIGGLLFAYMIYKSRQASAAADAAGVPGTGDVPDYQGAGGSIPVAGAAGATYGGGYGFTDPSASSIPTGAGTGASTDVTMSRDNAVTGENVADVLTAAGGLVAQGYGMGSSVPSTGGGAPARPHPAQVHAPAAKKDKQGHTAAQRAQIRHSSPAKQKAYQHRLAHPPKRHHR